MKWKSQNEMENSIRVLIQAVSFVLVLTYVREKIFFSPLQFIVIGSDQGNMGASEEE
jgi:hypothetical protein